MNKGGVTLDDISKHFVAPLQEQEAGGPAPNRHQRRALNAMNDKRIRQAKKSVARSMGRAFKRIKEANAPSRTPEE